MKPTAGETTPVRILVVDDDPDIREALRMTLCMVLEKRPHEVVVARHGREALDLVSLSIPNLVFLDLMMPILSGAEFLDVVRRDARFARMPVIVVSAWRREAKSVEGAQGFLVKPVNVQDLEEAVNKYCL
jgi:CheY-like chemotaxis protein